MKKIGVITFFKNYNYGSVLQCYAFQQTLLNQGENPVVINEVEHGIKWKIKKICRILKLLFSLIKYPQRLKKVSESRKESKRSCESLTKRTIEMYDEFIDKYIVSENRSYDELRKKSIQNEYKFFISGSDQVWGTSGYFLNPFLFLGFAPKSKKYSYAASFGSDYCVKWYEKSIRKYLKDYNKISVREEAGLKILQNYEIHGEIHVDPTMLLTKKEWEEIIEIPNNDDYIFLYFLNEPSKLAIQHIKKIIQDNHILNVFVAPYNFQIIKEELEGVKVCELSPTLFLGMIHNAKYVCSDSFHGIVFSILFNKNFYVYYRQYMHGLPQNNRLETLLKHFNFENQYVKEIDNMSIPNYENVDSILEKDRQDSINYLNEILGGNL